MNPKEPKINYYSEIYYNAFSKSVDDIVKVCSARVLKEDIEVQEDDSHSKSVIDRTIAKYKRILEKEFLECFEEEAKESELHDYLLESYELDQKEKIIAQMEEIGGGLVVPGSIT